MMRRIALCLGLLLAPLAARAADVPPAATASGIDFSTVLLDLDGKPIKDGAPTPADPDCAKCADITLGRAASEALCGRYTDDDRKEDDRFADCTFGIELRAAASPVATLTPEQLVKARHYIAKAFGPLVQTRAWQLLGSPPKP